MPPASNRHSQLFGSSTFVAYPKPYPIQQLKSCYDNHSVAYTQLLSDSRPHTQLRETDNKHSRCSGTFFHILLPREMRKREHSGYSTAKRIAEFTGLSISFILQNKLLYVVLLFHMVLFTSYCYKAPTSETRYKNAKLYISSHKTSP